MSNILAEIGKLKRPIGPNGTRLPNMYYGIIAQRADNISQSTNVGPSVRTVRSMLRSIFLCYQHHVD